MATGSSDSRIEKLKAFLAGQSASTIQYVTPSSPEYAEIRSAYIVKNPSIDPPVIIRPQNIEDVALITSFLVEHRIEFTVRSGGHDLSGRAFKADAVTVDMRLINHVQIDQQSLTAEIGGGIIALDLARKLGELGLAAAMPAISTVGYVGWATHGGYGLFSSRFGLGVDQILAAKVVNQEGKVVDADAELLKAIRGTGGAFGLIVQMTIPLFPLEKVLAGVLMFDSEAMSGTIRKYNDGYSQLTASETIPDFLSTQQFVINPPSGPTFGTFFVWSSDDLAEGEKWLAKIASLAPLAVNTVRHMTPVAWLETANSFVSKTASGRLWTISLKELTEEVRDIMSIHCPKIIPDPLVLVSVHQLRSGPSTLPEKASNSVFSARTPHYVFEIASTTQAAENAEAAYAWGRDFREALAKVDAGNILSETFLPMTPPEELNMARMYGENYHFLRELKNARDPSNLLPSGSLGSLM